MAEASRGSAVRLRSSSTGGSTAPPLSSGYSRRLTAGYLPPAATIVPEAAEATVGVPPWYHHQRLTGDAAAHEAAIMVSSMGSIDPEVQQSMVEMLTGHTGPINVR